MTPFRLGLALLLIGVLLLIKLLLVDVDNNLKVPIETYIFHAKGNNWLEGKQPQRDEDLVEMEEIIQNDALAPNSMLLFTPDIHDGTRIDLLSSILDLNLSIALSSPKADLPFYYTPPVPVSKWYNSASAQAQIVMPRYPVLPESVSPNVWMEIILKMNFDRIRKHLIIRQADCIICMFYPGQCQLFVPFNKSVLFLPAHRFLLNRCNPRSNQLLIQMLLSPHNHGNIIIRAADRFDAEYLNYYTGLSVPIIYASSLFSIPEVQMWEGQDGEILVAPLKLIDVPYEREMMKACEKRGVSCRFTTIIKKKGRNWKVEDIRGFKAAVVFPYAVVSYYLLDIMATAIPLFVPSPSFLLSLRIMNDVMNRDEKYCGDTYFEPKKSPLSRHLYSPEDKSDEARLYWLKYASFYAENTISFDDWSDLAEKMDSLDFKSVYESNLHFNRKVRQHNQREWREVIKRVKRNQTVPNSYEEALRYFRVSQFMMSFVG